MSFAEHTLVTTLAATELTAGIAGGHCGCIAVSVAPDITLSCPKEIVMDLHEMRTLVEQCSYKPGWTIMFNAGDKVRHSDGASSWHYDRPYVQIMVSEEAEASMESSGPNKFEREPWKGGKKYLSPHMCRQEIVGVVWGAIKDAEIHEAAEWFRYKGASIYNQHLDPDALAILAKRKHNFNVRDNAMSMTEN